MTFKVQSLDPDGSLIELIIPRVFRIRINENQNIIELAFVDADGNNQQISKVYTDTVSFQLNR